jgi:hypothetical protein
MPVEAPPLPPSQDELDAALIEEARRRARRRRLGYAASALALLAVGGVLYGTLSGGDQGRSARSSPSRAARPPACRSSQISQVLATPQGATQALAIPAKVRLVRGSACRLNTEASFSIRSAGGPVGSIKGNPVSWRIDALLRRDQPALRVFGWRNWCGRSQNLTFAIALPDGRATRPIRDHPICVTRAFPSTLSRLPGSP